MAAMKKKFPSNYVSILDLKEKWLKLKQQKEEDEQKKIQEQQVAEIDDGDEETFDGSRSDFVDNRSSNRWRGCRNHATVQEDVVVEGEVEIVKEVMSGETRWMPKKQVVKERGEQKRFEKQRDVQKSYGDVQKSYGDVQKSYGDVETTESSRNHRKIFSRQSDKASYTKPPEYVVVVKAEAETGTVTVNGEGIRNDEKSKIDMKKKKKKPYQKRNGEKKAMIGDMEPSPKSMECENIPEAVMIKAEAYGEEIRDVDEKSTIDLKEKKKQPYQRKNYREKKAMIGDMEPLPGSMECENIREAVVIKAEAYGEEIRDDDDSKKNTNKSRNRKYREKKKSTGETEYLPKVTEAENMTGRSKTKGKQTYYNSNNRNTVKNENHMVWKLKHDPTLNRTVKIEEKFVDLTLNETKK